MVIDKLNKEEWNSTIKGDEVSVGSDNDIYLKIDNTLFCCETKNCSNNIMVYTETFDIKNIKRMYLFVIYLFTMYNIEYISVCGTLNRYGFLEKKFNKNVIRDPKIKDKRQLYIKLNNEVMFTLIKEIVK